MTLGKSESHLLSTQPAMTNTTTSHQNHANIPPTQPVTVTSNITNETTDKPFKFIPKKHSESKFSKNTTTEANLLERNVTAANFDNETFTLSALNQSYSENDTSLEYVDGTEPTRDNLSAAGITGITVGCIGIVGMICAVSFVIYRNRGLNRPHVLNDRCSNPDSSGYIDDASIRVSWMLFAVFIGDVICKIIPQSKMRSYMCDIEI